MSGRKRRPRQQTAKPANPYLPGSKDFDRRSRLNEIERDGTVIVIAGDVPPLL